MAIHNELSANGCLYVSSVQLSIKLKFFYTVSILIGSFFPLKIFNYQHTYWLSIHENTCSFLTWFVDFRFASIIHIVSCVVHSHTKSTSINSAKARRKMKLIFKNRMTHTMHTPSLLLKSASVVFHASHCFSIVIQKKLASLSRFCYVVPI